MLLLRISIPVDIYSSPVKVEVDGVECQLRVKETNDPGTAHTNHDRKRERTRMRSSSAPTSRSKHHGRARGSNFVDDDYVESVIPTAVNLAQSFLQTEPEEEKAELEAAILSANQQFGTSSMMSEDGENEIPMGTGTALSLPAFMTRFLWGIGDRLEIRIQGITITLDAELSNDASKPLVAALTDLVTVQLKVDKIDIEGVTLELEKPSTTDKISSKPKYKKGKRLICLSKIQGAIISEANLFSSLARSSAMSSPSATHSDLLDHKKADFKTHSSVHESGMRDFDGASSDRSSNVMSDRLSTRSLSKATRIPSLCGSGITSDSGRFEDALEDEDEAGLPESLGADLDSEAGESIFQNSAYLDQVTESQYLDDDDEQGGGRSPVSSFAKDTRSSIRSGSHLSTPRASIHFSSSARQESEADLTNSRSVDERVPNSTILSTGQHSRFSQGRVSQSQHSLAIESPSPDAAPQVSTVRTVLNSADETVGSGEDDSPSPIGEDLLAQSQLFSHEDAESMYMSAISQGSSPERIPGRWAHSSSGSDGTSSAPDSPTLRESRNGPLDNLEHARHTLPIESASDINTSSHTPQKSVAASPVVQMSTSENQVPSLAQTSSNASERSTTSSDEYNRMTKYIFNLDQMAIYIPGFNKPSTESPGAVPSKAMLSSTSDGQVNISRSASINIPGAFSTNISGKPIPPAPTTPPMVLEMQVEVDEVDTSIEIELGHLLVHFDVSVGRIVWKLFSKLKEALKQQPGPSGVSEPSEEFAEGLTDMDLKFSAERISLMFLERLEGALGSDTATSESLPRTKTPEADILLRTTIEGLHSKSRATHSKTDTSMTLRKFAFGYAKENILSFDAGLRVRSSVRDLNASAGIDVSINIFKTTNSTRFDIKTLPMHVSIDLQRLDETFSWFGGLSSVLNMGSSIASNATITATNAGKPKPRGVRFETPMNPDEKSFVTQNKIDIRLGGFILDLVGTQCSVGVETSAVKIVSRDEGIGVVIQKIRLSGPHVKNSNEDPSIDVEITSARIEYLPSPKDVDLDTLLSLITPSKAKYDQDDDILLGTLLRQRKQGSLLRLAVDDFQTCIGRLDELRYLPELGEEISRLSTVAKYLPEDDRPGLLSLIMVKKFNAQVDVGYRVGTLQLASMGIEIAHITFPSLIALSIRNVSVHRNGSEELVGPATEPELRELGERAPAIMARMIGDEMEPIVKIKIWNLKAEYRVPTLIAFLNLGETVSAQDFSASLVGSVATLTDLARSTVLGPRYKGAVPVGKPSPVSNPMTLDIVLRDCILGLNPLGLPSKVLFVLTETHLSAVLPKDKKSIATSEIGKASILLIDDVANIIPAAPARRSRRESFDGGSSQVAEICTTGFVSVSYISSAKAIFQMVADDDGEKSIDVELRDDLFVLESCADSTQTLIAVLNGLAPPTPPSKEVKYRTKVIPVEDLLASLSGDAFGTAEGEYNFDDDFGGSEAGDIATEEDSEDLDFVSHYYQNVGTLYDADAYVNEEHSAASSRLTTRDTQDGVLLESFIEPEESSEESDFLDFQEDHFGTGSVLEGTAHRWNSAKNTYDQSNSHRVRTSPLKVCVRDVHIIWNLFDGYDWQHTRDTISKAVQDMESKAIEKRSRNERRAMTTFEQDIEDEETVIGDFLFNSIYIGIPANRDPRELAAAINQELNDNATETESIATTSLSSSPSRQGTSRRTTAKRLRLKRSRHHKITFELRGVSVDFVAFSPGSGETQSSIDVRIHDFEIFDHVPTSTWRKFAAYMQDAGERETGTSMIHIEILNVKPVPELAASEIVLKATVLPLRLHVDQDALDFITRFFEFKDDSAPVISSPGDAPFLQRVEVNSVQVKLDFKPKRVDYAGLRSGHTTEFMNFLILDEADMVLRHTIIYGISGFDKLGKTLNDIWMPDIKRNQLPGILAGLAPVRSLVNVGGGLRHLVVVPMREYKKDGRIVRSISKGAAAFAKTTGTELVKLGAKVAIGVQTVLQGAEGLLSSPIESPQSGMEDDEEEEVNKQISLYANQPVGVLQGLRGGYAGLQRDLILARDAIIAVPGEVMEGGNAAGVLRAVRKHAPTVILRPAIGVAKAGGQILMGATNSLDPVHLQRAEAVGSCTMKYKCLC